MRTYIMHSLTCWIQAGKGAVRKFVNYAQNQPAEVMSSIAKDERRSARRLLLPPKDRAGQVVMMARMNCLGDLYPRAR